MKTKTNHLYRCVRGRMAGIAGWLRGLTGVTRCEWFPYEEETLLDVDMERDPDRFVDYVKDASCGTVILEQVT